MPRFHFGEAGASFCKEEIMESQLSSPEITELASAMIRVQHSLSPALRDAHNTFTNSRYATLGSVMHACREALLAQGIWLTQYPVPVQGHQLGLVTKIVHAESGQWQASLLTMPLPKEDPQGYGSAMTYARRYGLSALVGIVTEDDDDGEMATAGREAGVFRIQAPTHGVPAPADGRNGASQGRASGDSPLPRLDGVQFHNGTASDGRPCVLATGETHAKRDLLRQAGFRWDGARKVWWRHSDAA
jgi:hypothetical protein